MLRIDEKVTRWLRACGWPEKYIESLTPETELLRDLDWLGDSAEEELTVLRDTFRVDFAHFAFHEHFASELGADALWITLYGSLRLHKRRARIVDRYRPITLDDVRSAIERGSWSPSSPQGGGAQPAPGT